MTGRRWQRVRALFEQALEVAQSDRRAFVVNECQGDDELVDEVMSLVEAHDRESGFSMGSPLAPRFLAHLCPRCGSRFDSRERVCPNDGEVLVDDTDSLIGSTLDGVYDIVERVGNGAMGTVYRARHRLLHDDFAIKVMASHIATDPDWLRRFLREGKAARAISHPNVVTIHDLRAPADGLAFMVQEFIEGKTLRDLLEPDRLMPWAKVREVMRPIASALDSAHEKGIVHRDLKPENIMIGTVGGRAVVKLMDLGIAKLIAISGAPFGSPTAITSPGLVMGTPAYMSPEQWGMTQSDGRGDVDQRADVYSLGVIVFELLAGQPPFRGQSIEELRRQHLAAKAPFLGASVRGAPAAAGEVLAQALAKDRSSRPATAGALIADLDRAYEEDGAALLPATRVERRWFPAAWPHGAFSFLAAIVGVAVLLAVLRVALWITPPGFGERNVNRPTDAPSASATIADRAIDVRLASRKTANRDEVFVPTSFDRTFDTKDVVRFEVTSSQAGHLFIFNETLESSAHRRAFTVLFPDPAANSGSTFLEAGYLLHTGGIGFDTPAGTERVWVVWAADLTGVLLEVAGLDLSHDPHVNDARLSAELAEVLVAGETAKTMEDARTRFTRISGAGPVLVYSLTLEHR